MGKQNSGMKPTKKENSLNSVTQAKTQPSLSYDVPAFTVV